MSSFQDTPSLPPERPGASFEEKSVWITLICLLVLFTGYFAVAAQMLGAGVTASAVPYVPLFTLVVILLVVLLTVGHAIAAITSRPEGRDERDQVISWKAENHSSWLLGVGVLAAAFALATPIGPAWIANGLLMALFLAELLKHSLQLLYYRRGI